VKQEGTHGYQWLQFKHHQAILRTGKESNMAENVYKVIALVGTSNESWEKAAAAAVERASQTLRDLRVARIVEQDIHIEPGKPLTYRVKVEISFKYEGGA
jgi:flavin-binding protein dodecin